MQVQLQYSYNSTSLVLLDVNGIYICSDTKQTVHKNITKNIDKQSQNGENVIYTFGKHSQTGESSNQAAKRLSHNAESLKPYCITAGM